MNIWKAQMDITGGASGQFDETGGSALRFHRGSLWDSILARKYEKSRYLPEYRFLDITLYRDHKESLSFMAPLVDIRDIASCNMLNTLMPLHGSDRVVTLSRTTEEFSLARAMPIWRSLVIFTRAARAGYGAIVHGRGLWLQRSAAATAGKSVQHLPAIEARLLAYFAGMSVQTLDVLLSPFVTAGIVGRAKAPTRTAPLFYYIQPGILQVLPALVGRDYLPVLHSARPGDVANAFPGWCMTQIA